MTQLQERLLSGMMQRNPGMEGWRCPVPSLGSCLRHMTSTSLPLKRSLSTQKGIIVSLGQKLALYFDPKMILDHEMLKAGPLLLKTYREHSRSWWLQNTGNSDRFHRLAALTLHL